VHGQGAFVVGAGALHAGPARSSVPIASLAKVMTALLVLRTAPLSPRAVGFRLQVDAADVADTAARRADDESVLAVESGEVLTERQALVALLLPSANNIAIMLAHRTAGSVAAFVGRMNGEAIRLGMRDTRYTDPSGLAASTVSTAADQVRLAVVAMRNPTLRAIVRLPRFPMPVVGQVTNTDTLLGSHGIVGIKTGSDDAAGGCFMFRARRHVAGRTAVITGVVLGQDGHNIITAGLYAGLQLADRAAASVALLAGTAVTAAAASARPEWPTVGQAGFAYGGGRMHLGPRQHAAPIASMAKVMTAVVMLSEDPMTSRGGFRMSVTRADVADWQRRADRGESTVAVRAGERLTERQALAAIMLPSANNVAIMIARRVSGTVARFVAAMNRTARRLGMTRSHYTDPSGYDAATRSTPRDQIVLVRKAMHLPSLRAMAARTTYVLPVAGRVYNYDTLLGRDGFVGVKTGSMSQSGGCFVFLSHRRRDGRRVDVYGVVMGQQGGDLITPALRAADRLVRSVSNAASGR
jgi:D-alanyl-D-alanine carboxypeptidase (penicillin-binding protein 5/6)